ncbi:hypothetical protein D915_002883 [Fasciola hepatica]|uniref:Uncharacterized protein n=1 Tax=Fasciola hepatica TaxID=6192 RepID=A0A4E0S2T6_FASHE|nr:hypothetical protein D915_002883 [Fasciola hepatica]
MSLTKVLVVFVCVFYSKEISAFLTHTDPSVLDQAYFEEWLREHNFPLSNWKRTYWSARDHPRPIRPVYRRSMLDPILY